MALEGKKVNFDKVLKMIDEMVDVLGKEQQDDDHKKEVVVWESSNGGVVWGTISGSIWVYCSSMMGVVNYIGVRFRVGFTLGNIMTNWVDVWVTVGGVWGNVLNLSFGVFNSLSDFMLLFSDLDRVSLFWNTLFGHSFGVVWVNILDNWGNNRSDLFVYNRLYNWFNNRYLVVYNRLYNMISIGVDNRYTSNSVVRVDQPLSISFWLSKSNGHKGKQSNEAKHC